MVEVLILYPEMSSSSNSPNKARVIHVVLLITVTWHGLDEPTPKDPLTIIWRGLDEPTPKDPIFHSAKKKNKAFVGTLPQLIGFIRFGEPVPHGLSARHRVWAGPTKG